MKNSIALVTILSLFVFALYSFFRKPVGCRLAVRRLCIDTVQYDRFSVSIPVRGEMKVDSVLNHVTVSAEMDQLYLPQMLPGLKASTTVDNSDYFLTLRSFDSVSSEGRFKGIFLFDKDTLPVMQPGRALRMRLYLSSEIKATLLAVGSFYKDTGGRFVYVVTKDKAVVKRNVILGRKNTDFFEVIAGLEPGEAVITSSYEGVGEADTLSLQEITDLYE